MSRLRSGVSDSALAFAALDARSLVVMPTRFHAVRRFRFLWEYPLAPPTVPFASVGRHGSVVEVGRPILNGSGVGVGHQVERQRHSIWEGVEKR